MTGTRRCPPDGVAAPGSLGDRGPVPEARADARLAPTRAVLDNGLTVLHQANPVSAAVTISLRVAAGAALDAPETAGLAHFTAAMLERGSRRRSKEEIGEVLDFTGADLGGGAGRHTAAVAVRGRVADLETLMGLLAECAVEPSFPAAEVEKLRGELLTAIREDADDPARVAVDRLRAAIYPPEHPYARRVLGTERTVAALGRDELVAFHRRHFAPQGAVLVVVGNVGAERALQAAARAFGQWGDATRPVPSGQGFAAALPPVSEAPGPAAAERVVVPMPGKSQVDIALGRPALRRRDPDYYAALLMNAILGRFAMGGRLGRTIREEQGMAYYAFSALEAGVGPGPWVVRAGVHPRNVERTVEAILAEVERMISEPVSEQELADAASALVRSLPRSLETNEGMASLLHLIEQYELGADYLDRYPELIGQVTPEQVQAVARRVLDRERYGLAIAGPYGAGPAAG